MSGEISFHSIEEIDAALVDGYNPDLMIEYLQENFEKIRGSEEDYHNLSVDFQRRKLISYAATVASFGIKRYPMSTDLLADFVKYSQEIGSIQDCLESVRKLNRIDKKYWTWRTFVFVIDFYKDSLSTLSTKAMFENYLEKASEIIRSFKLHIPHDERAYVAEAELFQKQNRYSDAVIALEDGVDNVTVAPQCCMKLAEMYLEFGKYAEVEKYARKGLLATMQDQPTVSIAYLYFLLALAMDAQRLQAKEKHEQVELSTIKSIITAYNAADKLFINEGRPSVAYRKTIRAKLIIIRMEEHIPEDLCQPSESRKRKAELVNDKLNDE